MGMGGGVKMFIKHRSTYLSKCFEGYACMQRVEGGGGFCTT